MVWGNMVSSVRSVWQERIAIGRTKTVSVNLGNSMDTGVRYSVRRLEVAPERRVANRTVARMAESLTNVPSMCISRRYERVSDDGDRFTAGYGRQRMFVIRRYLGRTVLSGNHIQ